MKYGIKILKDTPIDNMGDVLDFSTWTKKYNYLYPYTYVLFKDKEIKAFFNDSLWAKTFNFNKWFELVKVTKQQKKYDSTRNACKINNVVKR